MLIFFNGKGCRHCPCLSYDGVGERFSCGLSGVDGMDKDEKLPEFKPNLDKKPKDCPFASYPNTLEIQARESD